MRYPSDHNAAVREGIVQSAARALRRKGLGGISIPGLMKQAGLTHGGFYVHFKNRDELVAAAILAGAQQTADRVLSQGEAGLDTYLSAEHVAHPDEGCVLAALGTEGRTQAAPVRRAFATVARGFIAHVQRGMRLDARKGPLSDAAIVLASRMIGAVILARLVDDDALAARILKAARKG